MTKIPCTQCGVEILPSTAEKYGGLCAPCKAGTREGITRRRGETLKIERKRHVDGMLIDIEKLRETADTVEYAFISDVYDPDPRYRSRYMIVGQNKGVLRLVKSTGEIVLLEPMPEDDGGKRFQRAAAKVMKHWQAGEFPERTTFASG